MSEVNASVAAADVVILVIGLAIEVTNGEGTDRGHAQAGYTLPGKQEELVRLVASFNKPTVVVLLSGMAVGIDYIASRTRWPLLVPGYGGQFGAVAIAQALFGHVSPSGKLPYTIYPDAWAGATSMVDKSLTAGAGRTYKWYNSTTLGPPTFPFGSGMSYTTFSLAVTRVAATDEGGVSLSLSAHPGPERVEKTHTPGAPGAPGGPHGPRVGAVLGSFTVSTTNTGPVASSDATLVFIVPDPQHIDSHAPRPLPNRQLIDFVRTPVLQPGQSYSEVVHVRMEDVAMTDYAGATVAYAGTYGVWFSNGAGCEANGTVVVAVQQALDQLPLPPGFK